MELDGDQVLPSGRRTEACSVIRLADEVLCILRHGVVGVDEVERLTVEAFEDGVIPHHGKLVPSDVRDLEVADRKAHYLPRHKPESLHPRRLLGGLEDDL